MTTIFQETRLRSGLRLQRYYDPAMGAIDKQCGQVSWHEQKVEEVRKGPLALYDRQDGTSKFLDKIVVRVYGTQTPMPADGKAAAYTWPRVGTPGWGPGTSEVFMNYTPAELDYNFPAFLAHELGHAYDNWCVIQGDTKLAAEWSAFWQRQMTKNHTIYDPAAYPWNQPDSLHPQEAFANACRYFFGTIATRGVGAPREQLPAGFEAPENNLEWGRMLALRPETSAYIQRHGIWPGTFSWAWGNGFRFRNDKGTWMAHWYDPADPHGYWYWFEYANDAWVRVWPDYNRF